MEEEQSAERQARRPTHRAPTYPNRLQRSIILYNIVAAALIQLGEQDPDLKKGTLSKLMSVAHTGEHCDQYQAPIILPMKQEERQSVEEQLGWQQEKLKAIYHRIEACVDRVIELYSQAERAVRSGGDAEEVIAQLNRELLALKPLKSVREHFVHHYRKLSNLTRKMQLPNNPRNGIASSRYSRRANSEPPSIPQEARQQQKFGQFFGAFINRPQQLQMLQQMIVEHYLRRGEWECASVWGKLESEVDPSGLFRESLSLRNSIRRGQLIEAIKWCENQRLYETHNCYLQYDLKIAHLLGLMQGGNENEVLNYYMNSFGKFLVEKKQEMEKLCLFIFFRINKFWDQEVSSDANFKQNLDQRYKIFEYSAARLNKLSDEFLEQYIRQNNLPRFDSLGIIYNCSQKIMDEYMRKMRLVWDGKQRKEASILPFSVKIDREYQYHSLFFCPITKEVHSSNQSSKLLACGHLISDTAHNRIVQENRNRRKIKCPICQKQIKPQDSLKTEF